MDEFLNNNIVWIFQWSFLCFPCCFCCFFFEGFFHYFFTSSQIFSSFPFKIKRSPSEQHSRSSANIIRLSIIIIFKISWISHRTSLSQSVVKIALVISFCRMISIILVIIFPVIISSLIIIPFIPIIIISTIPISRILKTMPIFKLI